jgi:hypothetical protein
LYNVRLDDSVHVFEEPSNAVVDGLCRFDEYPGEHEANACPQQFTGVSYAIPNWYQHFAPNELADALQAFSNGTKPQPNGYKNKAMDT